MNVVITGTNFTGATVVSFGAGIVVNSFVVDLGTQITADISILISAALGARDVSVTAPFGTGTLLSGFMVTTPGIPLSPSVETLAATVRGNKATLNGVLVNDEDLPCDVWFEWGASRSYGMTTQRQSGMHTADLFSANLTTLSDGVYYHCRAVASGRGFTVYGRDIGFSTPPLGHIMSLMDPSLMAGLED
jgi:hypothetical protein